MERKLQINWSSVVEEAKQRRKDQRLTQKKLATMAGVSTPTVSRFESGEEDIMVSSAISILTVLGLADKRHLSFNVLNFQEQYDPDKEVVTFQGKDGDKTIQCGISREALEDNFDAHGKDVMSVFRSNWGSIEYEAKRKYVNGRLEPDGSLLIRSRDL